MHFIFKNSLCVFSVFQTVEIKPVDFKPVFGGHSMVFKKKKVCSVFIFFGIKQPLVSSLWFSSCESQCLVLLTISFGLTYIVNNNLPLARIICFKLAWP